MSEKQRAVLAALFETAVAAAHPAGFLVPHLPAPPKGRLIVIAAGKAGGSMAETAALHYRASGLSPERIGGVSVARHGYNRMTSLFESIDAGHPVHARCVGAGIEECPGRDVVLMLDLHGDRLGRTIRRGAGCGSGQRGEAHHAECHGRHCSKHVPTYGSDPRASTTNQPLCAQEIEPMRAAHRARRGGARVLPCEPESFATRCHCFDGRNRRICAGGRKSHESGATVNPYGGLDDGCGNGPDSAAAGANAGRA